MSKAKARRMGAIMDSLLPDKNTRAIKRSTSNFIPYQQRELESTKKITSKSSLLADIDFFIERAHYVTKVLGECHNAIKGGFTLSDKEKNLIKTHLWNHTSPITRKKYNP